MSYYYKIVAILCDYINIEVKSNVWNEIISDSSFEDWTLKDLHNIYNKIKGAISIEARLYDEYAILNIDEFISKKNLYKTFKDYEFEIHNDFIINNMELIILLQLEMEENDSIAIMKTRSCFTQNELEVLDFHKLYDIDIWGIEGCIVEKEENE